jgi:hypothetical protein
LDRSELLARAIHAIAELPVGVAPSRDMLAGLRHGWNNDWSANVAYLDEVARRAVAASGPILECGSGATTLLLAALAAKRGVEVWALEHSPDWYLYVYAAIAQLKLPPVNICLCPLQGYGEFSWYTLPPSELPRDISLVVCDGPPGITPGGRYGLWPLLGGRLAPGAVILLDDANREPERAILARWLALSGGTATTTDRYATLVLPS